MPGITSGTSDPSISPVRWKAWLSVAAVLAVCGYLAASALTYRIGYPLDDAWIHQTYARNLAERFEFSFLPGQPSAGSTSPLWSLLLAVGYPLFHGPFPWGYILGTICLAGIAITGEAIFRAGSSGRQSRIPWMGLFLALEWHLVWAAGSGMETALFALAILGSFWLVNLPHPKPLLVGLVIGLTIWIRPDGLTLLGPAGLVFLTSNRLWKERIQNLSILAGGFLLFAIPYLGMNQALSGTIWPNTYYAKQLEYAALLETPIWLRFGRLVRLGFIGPGLLLIPGIVAGMIRAIRCRQWPIIGFFLWWIGTILLYAARLPVEYQHGRYLMAAMPVSFVLGGIGTADLLSQRWVKQRMGFVISRVWLLSILGLWAGFYVIGARTYAVDVGIIETEMVRTAQWVRENTSENDLIAVHDIGAMGFYGDRKIIDLAGLVTPEVIPFLRDEPRLAEFLDERNVAYLVTLKDWYPDLEGQVKPVYQTGGSFSPQAGGTNMVVYRWKSERK